MKKLTAYLLLAFLALGYSKSVLASVIPATPPAASQDDIVVVYDDEFLEQQPHS